MKASELIYDLRHLIEKHGDKIVFVNDYEVIDVGYDADDDSIDILA